MTPYVVSYISNNIPQTLIIQSNSIEEALSIFREKNKNRAIELFNIKSATPEDYKPGIPILP